MCGNIVYQKMNKGLACLLAGQMAVEWVQKKNVQLMYLLELAAEGVEVQWKNMQVMHLLDLDSIHMLLVLHMEQILLMLGI